MCGIIGIVAKSAYGEMADDTQQRLAGNFHGDGARHVLDAIVDQGAFKVGGTRGRLLRRVEQLIG